MEKEYNVRIVEKIVEVDRTAWDRLLNDGSPFMKWDWLEILEKTGCVSPKQGWAPHHIIIEKEGRVVAACPMYLKSHSMGEFVHDYEWAWYASRAGIEYYPKLLVGVPFTPVTGTRILTDTHENRARLIQMIGQVLIQISKENKISSAHVNFCLEDEVEALKQLGFMHRVGLQYHWQNQGFSTFDDYLDSFRSNRRTKIKKERRELQQQGITIRAVEEDELTADMMRTIFHLYKYHVDQHVYGRQYLNLEFFQELLHRFRHNICLIIAEKESRIIGGTFNVQNRSTLFGRYWGTFKEHRFLHFNVCYYSAIEYCIRKGKERFEAGAGGSFKHLRGLEPQRTGSVHFILHQGFKQALQEYLKKERIYKVSEEENMLERSPLKK